MIETVADRIKMRMDELGTKQVDLINKSVASKGSISLWLSGGAVPSGERLVKLARELKTSESWLLTGDGDKNGRTDRNVDYAPIAPVATAPVLSWVQAGAWTGMENVELTGTEEQIPLVPGASNRSFYLIVRGISNAPFYNEGELICVDPTFCLDDIQTGEMVVVRRGNDATFKALVHGENRIFLKALNKDWQPNIMPLDDECIFVGKYVGSLKPATRHHFIV
ncbi:putative repressor protein C2 [Acinetobacter sp. WC-323]|uniref:LexA family protein n=1 Tax=Acinetobacter sp. WC-323 TaxID=903918 RepID=UPI00029EAFF5|nr:S24 family peptidase [Acinetobacter sp. WC-323]EKU56534.1 putative repressor protein C2 [Acinetobacter sp. WC-323]